MILVTGGTGLVGSHLLCELTAVYERIRALHRPFSDTLRVLDLFSYHTANPQERFDKIEWIAGDITDLDSVYRALESVDYVYHAAANVFYIPGRKERPVGNNVEGTAMLVNACLEKNVRKLCHVSSTAALGNAPRGQEITEDLAWAYSKNRSQYSISKFNSEMEVWRGMAEGLEAIILNPSVIIGPGNWSRSSPYLFTAVWNGLRYYPGGSTGFVDVRDVVAAMIQLMESDISGERFTVSGENLTYRQVLSMIAETLGRKPPRVPVTRLMTSLAWRADWLVSFLAGKPRKITRDTAISAGRKALFSNRKIRDATGLKFIPVERSIKDTGAIFLREHAATR
jgi:nucleoside-diphosphate-sugar epimerase